MKPTYQSYEDFIEEVDEFEIIQHYLPTASFKHFYSPFRIEKIPSAIIYIDTNGRLRFTDYRINEQIPNIVGRLLGLDYKHAVQKIITDFSNITTSRKTYQQSKKEIYKGLAHSPTIITPAYRAWKPYDIDYWGRGGITVDWLSHPKVRVFPIRYANIQTRKGDYTLTCDPLAYVYCYHKFDGIDRYKIYQPFNKTKKWVSNVVSGKGGVLQLYQTLPKTIGNNLLTISSSLKDSGTIYCNSKIWSIAPNNEGGWLPPQVIPKLKERFNNIITWFDQDAAGHTTADKYYQKYGFKGVFIPERYKVKDQYEFRSKYGKREFLQLCNYLLYEQKL